MDDEILDEEFSIMYEESNRVKVLDSNTFMQPIKHLKIRKPCTLEVSRPVSEAVKLMQEKEVACVLITKDSLLKGILTERDILIKAIGKDLSKMKAADIMTPDPEAFEPDDAVAFVINAMDVGGFRHIPVIDEQKHPIAVVSVKDIIGFIAEHFSQEVLNLPPKP